LGLLNPPAVAIDRARRCSGTASRASWTTGTRRCGRRLPPPPRPPRRRRRRPRRRP